jgi:hypothetical protein
VLLPPQSSFWSCRIAPRRFSWHRSSRLAIYHRPQSQLSAVECRNTSCTRLSHPSAGSSFVPPPRSRTGTSVDFAHPAPWPSCPTFSGHDLTLLTSDYLTGSRYQGRPRLNRPEKRIFLF